MKKKTISYESPSCGSLPLTPGDVMCVSLDSVGNEEYGKLDNDLWED